MQGFGDRGAQNIQPLQLLKVVLIHMASEPHFECHYSARSQNKERAWGPGSQDTKFATFLSQPVSSSANEPIKPGPERVFQPSPSRTVQPCLHVEHTVKYTDWYSINPSSLFSSQANRVCMFIWHESRGIQGVGEGALESNCLQANLDLTFINYVNLDKSLNINFSEPVSSTIKQEK